MKYIFYILLIFNTSNLIGQDLIGAQVTGKYLPIANNGVIVQLYTDYDKHIHRNNVQLYGDCQATLPLISKDTIENKYIVMEFFDTVGCYRPGSYQGYDLFDSTLVSGIKNINNDKKHLFNLSTTMRDYFFYPLYNPPRFTFPLNVSVDDFGIVAMNILVEDEEDDLFLVYVDTIRFIDYQLPQAFYNGGYWIDNNTHTLYWDAPTDTGKYLIALEAIEFTPGGAAINRIKYTQVVEIDASMLVNSKKVEPQYYKVEIFPNPSSDILNIEIDSNHQEVQSILLVGTNGQIIKTLENPSDLVSIDISQYPKGSYFLVFKTKKGVFTRKVIVQ